MAHSTRLNSARSVCGPTTRPSPRCIAPRTTHHVCAAVSTKKSWSITDMDGSKAEIEKAELSRKTFRTVYDLTNWQKHRSHYRLIDRLLQIPQSTVLVNVLPSIWWCGGIGLAVTLYMAALDAGMLPPDAPSIETSNSTAEFIRQTTPVLSLLLVFRTNASYGRWDEARKMWGLMLNRSRDLMRMGCTMMPDHEVERKKALGRWIIASARSLKLHFQPEVTLREELGALLSEPEIAELEGVGHRPTKAIHVMSEVIAGSAMDPITKTTLLRDNVTVFHDVLGGCERLLRAPIPVSYTRHTARFLFMWLSLLPFAIYHGCHEWTTPVVMGVAAVLCGIEEIGVQCEEPFGILPLAVICGRVEADVNQTLNEDVKVKAMLSAVISDPILPPSANVYSNGNGTYASSAPAPKASVEGQPFWVVK
ncbi:hypothetical protein FOA52_008929 [Chlamydomonas sp. UWO 241]|nr:hypothetical protein FOA52_008929 [Chlamydomonas sp. UWO 241]